MLSLVEAANGIGALDTLALVLEPEPEERRKAYLDALCIAWLGPIEHRGQRWDRGIPRGPRRWLVPYQPECVDCGDTFESSRVDALYCSGACRQRAHRRRLHEAVAP
jgi:hypothetical protein